MITPREEGKIKVCFEMKSNHNSLTKLNEDTFPHGSVIHR